MVGFLIAREGVIQLMPVEMNDRFTLTVRRSFIFNSTVHSGDVMKLKSLITLAACSALAMAGTAFASTFDAKTVPLTTNAKTAKMQVDVKEDTYSTAQVNRHSEQPQAIGVQVTNGYQYGAGKLKAKWIDDSQSNKAQIAATFTLQPSLATTDYPVLTTAKANKAGLFSLTNSSGVHDLSVNSTSIQLPSGQVIRDATDVGRAGLALGDAATNT